MACLTTLGELDARLGRYESAVFHLEEAVEVARATPVNDEGSGATPEAKIRRQLGILYAQIERLKLKEQTEAARPGNSYAKSPRAKADEAEAAARAEEIKERTLGISLPSDSVETPDFTGAHPEGGHRRSYEALASPRSSHDQLLDRRRAWMMNTSTSRAAVSSAPADYHLGIEANVGGEDSFMHDHEEKTKNTPQPPTTPRLPGSSPPLKSSRKSYDGSVRASAAGERIGALSLDEIRQLNALHKWHPPMTIPRYFWSSGYYNALKTSIEEVQKIHTDESLLMRRRLEASGGVGDGAPDARKVSEK